MRTRALLVTLLALLSPALARPAEEEHPRLYVLLVVDQLRSDVPPRYLPHLDGGLARIYRDGLVHPNSRTAHGVTETAPGHSCLLTGKDPAETGIVANGWYRLGPSGGRYQRVYAGADPDARLIDPITGEVTERLGAGPAQLREGLGNLSAEVLQAGGSVLSIAGKDRSAVVTVGRLPAETAPRHAVLWYDFRSGGFASSTAYAGGVPTWARAVNSSTKERIVAWMGTGWTADDEEFYEAVGAAKDDREGEFGFYLYRPGTKGNTFPHTAVEPLGGVRQTPFIDTLSVDLAIAGIEAMDLGSDDRTDLLALSLSAHDFIGHAFGPRSRESASHVRALDRELSRLLAALDKRVGKGKYTLVFTADHGVVDLIPGEAEGERRRRIITAADHAKAGQAMARFAKEEFGWDGETVGRTAPGMLVVSAGGIYLDPGFAAFLDGSPTRWARLAKAVPTLPGWTVIERAIPGALLKPFGPERIRVLHRSFVPQRSPHLYLLAKAGDYVSPYRFGTGHGAVHDYDRAVPLIVVRGERYRGRVDERPIFTKSARELLTTR